MKAVDIADSTFDVAVALAIFSVIALIWTFSLLWIQVIGTAVVVAVFSLLAARWIEAQAPDRPKQPLVGRPPPREDFVSEEAYDEEPISR